MFIKVRHELVGGHVHVGVWMGRHANAIGKCGTLTFRAEEWDALETAWSEGALYLETHGDLEIVFEEVKHDTDAD